METRDQRQNLWGFARHWRVGAQSARTPRGADAACKADALVVLGCKVGPEGEPSAALSRRLTTALGAYHDGLAPRILVCGGRRWGQFSEAESMKRWLLEREVPASSVLCDLCSLTTLENAVYCRELMRSEGLESLVLVTCDFHMSRALHNFRRVGLESVPLAAPTPGGVSWWRRVQERARRLLDHPWS